MSNDSQSTSAPKPGIGSLRRHLRYLKPARWHFLGGILAGLVYAAASGAGLPLMLYVVAPVIFGQAENTSNQARQVEAWSRWLFGADYANKLLLVACLGMPLIFLIRGVCAFLNRYWINYAGFIVLEGLRRDVFSRLQELPLAFYHRHKSGDLVNRLMNDTEQLKMVVVSLSSEVFKQPFTLLSAFGTLIYLSITNSSALFALIAMFSVPLCVIPIRLVSRRLMKKSSLLARESGDLAAVITESLQSPLEIQAYNLQPTQLERFGARIRLIFRHSMKTVKYQSLTSPIIEFISVCGFMAALYVGSRGGMDFRTFSALGFALYMCYEPIKKLSTVNDMLRSRAGSLERLEQVLSAGDSVPNPRQPKSLPHFPAGLAFEDVSFAYATRAEDAPPALSNVSVSISPGEIVALVGPSGAGKSTFSLLIPRFFDPTGGRILIGGTDLRELDKAALRDKIALVPQMPALFNASVAENIRVGRISATDEEVRAAAHKAFVADFIESLPQGYETIVGERGTALSGGQRQRIALARAFLKDTPILILDEATSALDSESEAKIQLALKELIAGRTTFMIAHRFSSISLATRVLVFEEGRITGDGTSESLLQTHPGYRRMSELQRLG